MNVYKVYIPITEPITDSCEICFSLCIIVRFIVMAMMRFEPTVQYVNSKRKDKKRGYGYQWIKKARKKKQRRHLRAMAILEY